MCRPCGLLRAVVEKSADGCDLSRRILVARQDGQKPADGFERELVQTFGRDETARTRRVAVAQPQAYVERVGDERVARVAAVVLRDVTLDVSQVRLRLVEHLWRNVVALLLGARERVRDVYAEVGPIIAASTPEAEAAVVVLHPLKSLDVALDGGLHLVRRWHVLRLEGREHVAKCGDGEHAR